MEEKWDHLIILDACRYDYFEKVYKNYLSGNLKKVVSPGSSTFEWCKKVFKDRYDDVVYISVHPLVNSKGIEVRGFNASKHFHRVVDVWDWGWDDGLDAVHPRTVYEAALKTRIDYPGKRLVIHFWQPHAPYITFGTLGVNTFVVSKIDFLLSRLRCFLEPISHKLIGAKKTRKLQTFLLVRWMRTKGTIVPERIVCKIARKVGVNGLRQAYEENLKIALEWTARLVKNSAEESW